MIVQSKIKVKENGENGVGVSKRRSTAEVGHWAFLEEIEAPMWVDLTSEPKLMREDKDDAWFHTSHLFHDHSARDLRAAFAHPDVGNDFFNFNLQGVCPPNLPSSVSKSRGKDYRSRDWRIKGRVSLSKGHPVNDLGSRVLKLDMGSNQECKPKVSCGNQSEASSLVTVVLGNGDVSSGGLNTQSVSTSGASTSTVTTVSQRQDSKVLEISKEAFGHTGGLLNALKTNLRKSCGTRAALRVEVCDEKESKGHTSSSGKSSTGSSSIRFDLKDKGSVILPKTDHGKQSKIAMNVNTISKGRKTSIGRPNMDFLNQRFEAKKMAAGLKQDKDRNPNVRAHLAKLAQPAKGRVKEKKMSEASVCTRKAYTSRMESRDAAAASTRQEASKSKVIVQKIQKNSSNRSGIEAPGGKGKVGSNQLNGFACRGKENIRTRAVFSQTSGHKDNMNAVKVSDQKLSKLKSENKVGGVALVGLKVGIGRANETKLASGSRVHLR